ncbi:hypothetical protein [Thermocatellispora tengchongensis]|uniref:hypothetical protein n=1 Tax=Thermocatellispora tengchongensis TaxID=1073253 RepID=UPI00362D38C0
MIDSAVTGLERVFDRAFILGAFLPLLLFTVLSGLLAGVVSGRGASAVSAWEKAPGITQGLVLGGLVALVAAAAYLVAALQFSLLRIMEGYWPRRLGLERLRRLATGRHRRRWDRLAQAERTAAEQGRLAEQNGLQMLMAQQYPPRTRLDLMMPTRLGNILRAAEIYPHERYGIDAAVIWPRLRPLLPDTATAAMDDARAAIDAFLLLRFLSMVFGTFWPVLLLLSGHGWPLAALCLLSGRWPRSPIGRRWPPPSRTESRSRRPSTCTGTCC